MTEDCFHVGIKALIRNSEGKILLLQHDYWDLPGGRMQKGETFEETLKREVLEETGLINMTNISFYAMALSNIRVKIQQQDLGLILAAYLCEVPDLSQITLNHESNHYGWFSPSEAAKLLQVKYPEEFTSQLALLNERCNVS